jgi:pimeloyl-ACP methyl ester carboxylesterase
MRTTHTRVRRAAAVEAHSCSLLARHVPGSDTGTMDVDWELREGGPVDAERTVLLLPGGLCGAGSYAEVMAEPALARMRLVAATLPGHAGAPPPDDYSVENYARLSSELAKEVGADLVVGFSIGASVALEMVASGGFTGPAVLLGISLSAEDEAAIFRAIVQLGSVLGSLPAAVLARGAASMVKRAPVSAERQRELREDFRKNVPQHTRQGLREYVRWLRRYERPAERLCGAGVSTWIMHAEKGDGGLTDTERRTLEACPHAYLVTIPGDVFFLPNEVPERIAEVVLEAVSHATDTTSG